MGMGNGPREWDDYVWCRLADEPATPISTGCALAAEEWLAEHPVWVGRGQRVLLVDLDNLRGGFGRLRDRMAIVVALADTADQAVFAGQERSVARSLPWLGRYAADVLTVADGPDVADRALLAAATPTGAHRATQFAVASNDGIFSALARHGSVILVSPALDVASRRLRAVATREVDMSGFATLDLAA